MNILIYFFKEGKKAIFFFFFYSPKRQILFIFDNSKTKYQYGISDLQISPNVLKRLQKLVLTLSHSVISEGSHILIFSRGKIKHLC